MKRWVKRLGFALLVWASVPILALATSGACSYHGGVSCSAGADWDGSVICNDGWRDSSVSYSSMAMCLPSTSSNATKHSCNSNQWDTLQSQYNLGGQQDKIDELMEKQEEAFDDMYDSSLSDEKRNQASENFYEISTEVLRLQSDLERSIDRAGRECDVLGEKNYKEFQLELLRIQAENDERERQAQAEYLQALQARDAALQSITQPINNPTEPSEIPLEEMSAAEDTNSSPSLATTTNPQQENIPPSSSPESKSESFLGRILEAFLSWFYN